MTHPKGQSMLRVGFSARLTPSWARSLTRWKLLQLKSLQRRERRLLLQLEKNRQRQVKHLQHPLYQEHLRQQLLKLQQSQPQELPPPFDLRHLL